MADKKKKKKKNEEEQKGLHTVAPFAKFVTFLATCSSQINIDEEPEI